MARGLALLVGLNRIDSTAYAGWDGTDGCLGCELDVDNFSRVLSSAGAYTINMLKTERATGAAVLAGVNAAARTLKSGDIFVFQFSGHGGQQPDTSGDEADDLEPDGKDETLLLYDRRLVDDELAGIWPLFAPGVRIVMVSDSCNSGTNHEFMSTGTEPTPVSFGALPGMRAQLLHFSGCRDGEDSSGYANGGAMTRALCDIWNGGRFQGGYELLAEKIKQLVADRREIQQPQFNQLGPVTPPYIESRPFAIQ